MTVRQLVQANRSYRRFNESVTLNEEMLTQWVDTARICMSAVNLQPLKYRLVTDAAERSAGGYSVQPSGPCSPAFP